ncbi:MAG: hypothetical protein AAF587_36350 [Bacteroidota bacterium]
MFPDSNGSVTFGFASPTRIPKSMIHTHADKHLENKFQSAGNESSPAHRQREGLSVFEDHRPEAIAQRKMQETANNSAQVRQLKAFQQIANSRPLGQQAVQFKRTQQASTQEKEAKRGHTQTVVQRQPTNGVIQRSYDDALRRESKHATIKRFKAAISYMKTANSNEIRWRNAQAQDAPNAIKDREDEFRNRMEQNRVEFDREFQVLRLWHNRNTGNGAGNISKDDFQQFDYGSANEDNPSFVRMLAGAMHTYKAEADRQHARGAAEDDLMLGYRSEVAQDPGDKDKILDTNIWSWGVNQAWIEGGASNEADFELHTPVGDLALGYLAYMNGEDFLAAIHPDQFPEEANTLWHNREDRPTWYALELASLLDMGYRLDPTDDTKLTLQDEEVGEVTNQVQNTGVDAYTAGE